MNGLAADLGVTRGDLTLGIAMAIEPGHTTALLGPNGSGKTTAIEALSGLIALDSGRIDLEGRVLDEPNKRLFVHADQRNIGVVFQDHLLFAHLSAIDNVAFGLRCRGVGAREAHRRAAEWLDRMGIPGVADRKPSRLSGGESQRVALARALIIEPDLLLLDEPLAALDATARTAMRRLLADHLVEFEGPTLLVTHDPTTAFLLADHIHIIEDGGVTQAGTADEIRVRPQTQYAADLAGVNLFRGTAEAGRVLIGGFELRVADLDNAGPVITTIHPRAVALYRTQPEGSPRNTWQTSVLRVEHYGDRVRMQVGVPLPVTAEITPSAEQALDLHEGSPVWVSIKATEIGVELG